MMKILKSDRGSTSILVVIFMIVLMIFGLSILTTSISNTRLAEKKREWLTDYYKLEEKVAYKLADIDQTINKIKTESQTQYNDNVLDETVMRSSIYYNNLQNQFTELGYRLSGSDLEEDKYVTLSFDLKEETGKIPKHIAVELKIAVPEDSIDETRFLELTNYQIIGHTEWQEPFEYEESIKFGDPFENPELSEEPLIIE